VNKGQRRRQASKTAHDSKERAAQGPSTHRNQSPPQDVPAGRSIFQERALWVCLGLIVGIVIVYAPVRSFDFVFWDDPIYVSKNPDIAGGITWQSVRWAFTTGHAGYWLPLIWLSYMLDVQVHGLSAGGFHVTNVLLHTANTLLLFGVLRRMTGKLGRSAFVAGLFALHPLHVESVAWVTERKDVLSTLFWMLATWTYVEWVRRPSWGRYAGLLLLFALGLTAKPMVMTLPLVLLLLDFWPLGRVAAGIGREQRTVWLRLVIEKVPLLVLALASSIVTFLAQRSVGAVGDFKALPMTYRVENALISYITYIGKMLWPVRLAAFYPFPMALSGWTLSVWSVLAAALALIVVSVLVMRGARRYPYLPVGWLWYLGTLIPVIGLVQVGGQAMADRFTYVPLIGLFLMAAWGIPDLLARWEGRTIPLTLASGFLLVTCAITANGQLQYWRDSTSLWTHVLEVTNENAFVHKQLSQVLLQQGKYDEAIAHYSRALQLMPDDADEQNNMANDLLHHNRVDLAIAHYSEALRIKPGLVEAHNNLANALMRQGRAAEALTHYSAAISIKPDYAAAHNGLGALLAGQGRAGEAFAHYSEALRIDPSNAEVHNNLGALLVNQGQTDQAIHEFSEAVRISPNKPDFHYNLGVMLKKKGEINEAENQFNAALKLDPNYQQARRALDTSGSGSRDPR
jgi:protein O-mannosyl-transferase